MSILGEIMESVDEVVKDYPAWSVGITSDPEAAEKKTANESFHLWDARSEVAARAILQYLLDRGMADRSNGDVLPSYVYIFREKA